MSPPRYRPPDEVPTGTHEVALHHLRELVRAMEAIPFQDPTGEFTLADGHRLSFRSIEESVRSHYRWAWRTQALRPARVVITVEEAERFAIGPGRVDGGHGEDHEGHDRQGLDHG